MFLLIFLDFLWGSGGDATEADIRSQEWGFSGAVGASEGEGVCLEVSAAFDDDFEVFVCIEIPGSDRVFGAVG